MYDHSREVYRRLRSLLAPDPRHPGMRERQLLAGCQQIVVELASEGGKAHRPAPRLFGRVRHLFPAHAQLVAYSLIEAELERVAGAMVDEARQEGRDNLLVCAGTTRRGKLCRREPLRGSLYCPSHRHLEDAPVPAVAVADGRDGARRQPERGRAGASRAVRPSPA